MTSVLTEIQRDLEVAEIIAAQEGYRQASAIPVVAAIFTEVREIHRTDLTRYGALVRDCGLAPD